MAKQRSRRSFLLSAPLAAAAVALPLESAPLFAQSGEQTSTAVPFKLFSAASLAEATAKLHAKPGNDNLFDSPALPLAVVMTTEETKSAKEFEWHEGRDHIVQILDGSTVYEVGGKPQSAHATKPGEWLAPAAQGATTYTLNKGDMLVIPRNTLHKRSTAGRVTFLLISTPGAVAKRLSTAPPA